MTTEAWMLPSQSYYDTPAEAQVQAAALLARITAHGQTPYQWADGVRAGRVSSTTSGYVVRPQGPPPPPGRRIASGGI
jgi:hypothetical protein